MSQLIRVKATRKDIERRDRNDRSFRRTDEMNARYSTLLLAIALLIYALIFHDDFAKRPTNISARSIYLRTHTHTHTHTHGNIFLLSSGPLQRELSRVRELRSRRESREISRRFSRWRYKIYVATTERLLSRVFSISLIFLRDDLPAKSLPRIASFHAVVTRLCFTTGHSVAFLARRDNYMKKEEAILPRVVSLCRCDGSISL